MKLKKTKRSDVDPDCMLAAQLFYDLSQPNVLAISDNLGRRIATVENLCDGEDNKARRKEMVAFLRMFVAAPEMLAALTELTSIMQDVRTGIYKPDALTLQPAIKAISNAIGENYQPILERPYPKGHYLA